MDQPGMLRSCGREVSISCAFLSEIIPLIEVSVSEPGGQIS